MPGGYLGVDIFFVISGYVITRILASDLDAGSFSLGAFWRRRARRIIPALAVMLAVCLPVAWILLLPKQMEAFLNVFLGTTALIPNLVLWSQVSYFAPNAETQPLLHLWSLGVEEQFYLLFPLVMLGLAHSSPRRRWWALFGLAVLSMIVATVLLKTAPRAGFFLLPSRVWELVAGALVALSLRSPSLRRRQWVSLLGLAMILVPVLTYGSVSPGLGTLPPVLGTALCLMAARPDTWVGKGLATRPMVLIGKISFGAYLWHWPLLAFVRIHQAGAPALTEKLALIGLALVLGWLSWRFVEMPFRRSERPFLPNWGAGRGLASLAALGLVGALALLAEAQDLRTRAWPGFQPAEMARIFDERHLLVRSGECHLRDDTMPTAPFRAAWNCPADARDGLRAWPVAVFGDSNASDVAMTLRMTGRNPMQLTGWHCAVVPSLMRPECRDMAEDLRTAAQKAGIKVVILANLWRPVELTPEALVELEIWWGEAFDKVVLVGPLPQFPYLDERLLRWPREQVAAIEPDLSLSETFDAARRRIKGSELIVINAAGVVLRFAVADCQPLGDGPLMQDESSHLSPEGAEGYARRLESSGLLESIAPMKNGPGSPGPSQG